MSEIRKSLEKLVGTSYNCNEFKITLIKVGKKNTLVECVNTTLGLSKIPQEMKIPNDIIYNEILKS